MYFCKSIHFCNFSLIYYISHLLTAYVKNYTGRLSAVCGCGVAASIGATAGLAWLMGCSETQIEGAIENMVANLRMCFKTCISSISSSAKCYNS